MLQTPEAVADDGLFDLTVIRKMSRLAVLLHFKVLFNGRIYKLRKISLNRGRRIRIESSPRSPSRSTARRWAILRSSSRSSTGRARRRSRALPLGVGRSLLRARPPRKPTDQVPTNLQIITLMKKLHLLMLCLAALAFCRCDEQTGDRRRPDGRDARKPGRTGRADSPFRVAAPQRSARRSADFLPDRRGR